MRGGKEELGENLWIGKYDHEGVQHMRYNAHPDNKGQPAYGHVIYCTDATPDANGNATAVNAKPIDDAT